MASTIAVDELIILTTLLLQDLYTTPKVLSETSTRPNKSSTKETSITMSATSTVAYSFLASCGLLSSGGLLHLRRQQANNAEMADKMKQVNHVVPQTKLSQQFQQSSSQSQGLRATQQCPCFVGGTSLNCPRRSRGTCIAIA